MAAPIKTFKAGPIQVAIFDNSGKFSATASRAYQDDRGEWKYASSFYVAHLPTVVKLMDLAATWMIEQESGGSTREEIPATPRRPFREARERSRREQEEAEEEGQLDELRPAAIDTETEDIPF